VALANGAKDVAEATPLIATDPDVILFDPGGWDGAWRGDLSALDALRRKRTSWFLIGLHVARRTDPHTYEARSLGADFVVLKGLRTSALVELVAAEVTRPYGSGDRIERIRYAY
jgi:hypothetical protein